MVSGVGRRLNLLARAAALLACTSTAPAAAGDGVPGSAYLDCKCRANGRNYALGERTCLYTPSGPRIAECRMVQNVTSWSVRDGEGCVLSGPGVLGSRG